jgi:uncharacterized cupredoxin-like copper-binding protein
MEMAKFVVIYSGGMGMAASAEEQERIMGDEPGEMLIGCHVPGHWEAGMRGSLLVMPGGEPDAA